MPEIETTSKVPLKLPSRINVRRRAPVEPPTLDTVHKPLHSLERSLKPCHPP